MSAADAALRRLETLCLIRAYEEKLVELQRGGAPGTCTSVGQEACAVGVMAALEPRDRILTNHRSAAHLIARGADPGRLMAEVLGRVDGYCGGLGGSLHISAQALGVVLTSTIVGGELSMAPGVALAQKMGSGEPGAITAVFFGDGAACEGIFHEALNLAVHWRLPLLFVCENNDWQAFVHRRETMADRAIANWAAGHGLAVDSDGAPRFLELVTYRLRGHFEPDDQAYVEPAELAAWRARDPLALEAARLRTAGILDDTGLRQIEARVAARIEAAVHFAQASAWPEPAALTAHVHARAGAQP